MQVAQLHSQHKVLATLDQKDTSLTQDDSNKIQTLVFPVAL